MTNYKTLKLNIENQSISILQRKDMFCVSLDTILLFNFIKLKKQTKTLIDFGTNNGAIAILLAKKYPVKIIGIEIQKEAIALALENVVKNNLDQQITIIHQDIKVYAEKNSNSLKQKVDVIVCNPPFFPLENINVKLEVLKVAARHEIYIDLDTIIHSAAELLKVKGKFFIIYPVTRLDELLSILKKYHFFVKRMQIVYPKINKNANSVLIEAVFKANVGLVIEPPLICHDDDNSYTSEIAKWYNKNNNK